MSLTRFFEHYGNEYILLMSTALVDKRHLICCSYVEGNTLYSDVGQPILDVYNNMFTKKMLNNYCLKPLMQNTGATKTKTNNILHNKVTLVDVSCTLDSFIFLYYVKDKTVEIIYYEKTIITKRVSLDILKLILKGISNDISIHNTVYQYFGVRLYPNTRIEKVKIHAYNITDTKLIEFMKSNIRDVILPSYSNRVEENRVMQLYNDVCISC